MEVNEKKIIKEIKIKYSFLLVKFTKRQRHLCDLN